MLEVGIALRNKSKNQFVKLDYVLSESSIDEGGVKHHSTRIFPGPNDCRHHFAIVSNVSESLMDQRLLERTGRDLRSIRAPQIQRDRLVICGPAQVAEIAGGRLRTTPY